MAAAVREHHHKEAVSCRTRVVASESGDDVTQCVLKMLAEWCRHNILIACVSSTQQSKQACSVLTDHSSEYSLTEQVHSKPALYEH